MTILISAFILLLSVGTADAQGWTRMSLPAPIDDLDTEGDSLIGLLSGGIVWESIDLGRTWKPFGEFSEYQTHVTSLEMQRSGSAVLLGSSSREDNHGIYYYGSASTSDAGANWGSSFWQYKQGTFPSHRHVVTRSPSHDFVGLHSRGDVHLGAIEISDYRTGRLIYQGSKSEVRPEHLMCALDVTDSVVLGVRGRYSPKYEIIRSTDSGGSWEAVSPMPGSFRARPTLRSSGSQWWLSFDSTLVVSTDAGSSWSTVLLAPASIKDFLIVGSVGYVILDGTDYILASTDSGSSWYAEGLGNASHLSRLLWPSDSIILAYNRTDLVVRQGKTPIFGPVLSTPRLIDHGKLSSPQLIDTIVLRNVGSTQLAITEATSSSGSIGILQYPTIIDTGEQAKIVYSYSPAGRDTTEIRISTNTATGTEVVKVLGLAEQGNVGRSRAIPSSRFVIGQANIAYTLEPEIILPLDVSVWDALGRELIKTQISALSGSLDIQPLGPGLYFLHVANPAGDLQLIRKLAIEF